MSMHPAISVFYLAGQRFIDDHKMVYAKDPCVQLTKDDDAYRTWQLFMLHEFGRQPYAMRLHEKGMLPSVTMPCSDPKALIPTLNVVRAELASGELASAPVGARAEAKPRRSGRR